MDWTYARGNALDHAFWCNSRRRKLAGGGGGKLLSWLLVWESSWVFFGCQFTSRAATVTHVSEVFGCCVDMVSFFATRMAVDECQPWMNIIIIFKLQ